MQALAFRLRGGRVSGQLLPCSKRDPWTSPQSPSFNAGDNSHARRLQPETRHNIFVYNTTLVLYLLFVTSPEFKRWLTKQGCTFEAGRGGHLTVRKGDKVTDLPMHGKQKELGTGIVNAIKKQLGLK